MPRRRNTPDHTSPARPRQAEGSGLDNGHAATDAQHTTGREPSGSTLQILIVACDKQSSSRLARQVAARFPDADIHREHSVASARAALDEQHAELLLIGCDLDSAFDLVAEHSSTGAACLMFSDDPDTGQALQALRAGAFDLVRARIEADDLASALDRALARASMARRREERIRRLTHICRRLNWSRREMSNHISGLCGDMINAFQEMADQVNQVTIASEFNGLIRQELDVESLLRTALEYILAKCGSTNAAVFLPAGSDDYSLGAYVNYDCPKDTLDMMLEHLAGIVAPRMAAHSEFDAPPPSSAPGDGSSLPFTPPASAHPGTMKVLPTEDDLIEFLGDDAHWLADSGAVTFACRHEGECLAVVILFRDRRNPFSGSSLELLNIISGVFAQQLARIVRVHHRHLPKDQWGAWGGLGMADDGDDDLDLAA